MIPELFWDTLGHTSFPEVYFGTRLKKSTQTRQFFRWADNAGHCEGICSEVVQRKVFKPQKTQKKVTQSIHKETPWVQCCTFRWFCHHHSLLQSTECTTQCLALGGYGGEPIMKQDGL